MSAPRKLKLDTEDAALAELAKLRTGYVQHGKWTLAQIAWHISKPMHYLDAPPPADSDERTPEQEAKKKGFVDYIIQHRAAPPHIKDAPPQLVPPADASDADIANLEAKLRQMKSHPHRRIIMGPIGPVDFDDYRKCNLFHMEHHLSFLEPKPPRPIARRPGLKFTNEQALIEDVKRLREGYVQSGYWTLAQIAYHLSLPIEHSLKPITATATTEQKKQQQFIEMVAANGWPEERQFPAPEQIRPPANVSDSAIDQWLNLLGQLARFDAPRLDMIGFGPIDTAVFKKFAEAHSAHHLQYLAPKAKARRAGLAYGNEDAVIEDVKKLRKGYEQSGSWSLPQVCHHLDLAVKARMAPGPFPQDSDEQAARKPVLEKIMASGQLPDGIVAPDPMIPPAHCGEDAIDAFLATMQQFKAFSGPIAPHRIFGTLNDADARKLNLIHCARHLSFLTPTT